MVHQPKPQPQPLPLPEPLPKPHPEPKPLPKPLPQPDPDTVCTIKLLLTIIAAAQDVPFACIHPIGSHLLGRGGNITIGNYVLAE